MIFKLGLSLQGAGWHREQVPRFPPLVEPHCMEVNAPLKLVWKFVAALPQECQAVLAAVDATHLTTAGTYTPVTVLLTPQVCSGWLKVHFLAVHWRKAMNFCLIILYIHHLRVLV